MGLSSSFWINGQEFDSNNLPLNIENKYELRRVDSIRDGVGALYALQANEEDLVVELRVMKHQMLVDIVGASLEDIGGLLVDHRLEKLHQAPCHAF